MNIVRSAGNFQPRHSSNLSCNWKWGSS